MKIKTKVSSPDYKDGEIQEYVFEFVKVTSKESDYGNRTYLNITKDGEDWKYIDHRYKSLKDFPQCCLWILQEHFGTHLKEAVVIEWKLR